MPLMKEDPSFRKTRTGAPVLARNGEYVCNIAKMLFGLKPGYDEYDPERGLDIQSKLFQTYVNEQRDSDYEARIQDQFQKYTDLVPANVSAIYRGDTLVIFMTVTYHQDIYMLDIIGDKNGLEVILRDQAIPKTY